MRTVVVTGGAGFIGSHLVERLLRDGHKVRVVDTLITGKRSNLDGLHGWLEFYAVSVTDGEALARIFEGAEVVFHHAALPSVSWSISDPQTVHAHNATGTLQVLMAARQAGVRRVVYAASSSAYGDTARPVQSEEMLPQPLSPYGVSKLAGELYCQVYSHVHGLETVCLRYFNVFGPRQDPQSQYAAVIPRFITAMLKGRPPTIYGDGRQSRDFTAVENIVEGNLLAADAPGVSGQVINLATGMGLSLLELVERINTAMGTHLEPVHEAARPGDILHSRASIDKARKLLNYVPVVDLDTGLARTIDWYRSHA